MISNKRLCLTMAAIAMMCAACRQHARDRHDLAGAWTLRQMVYPDGTTYNYPNNGITYCRIFDADSTVYGCQLMATASGMVVIPEGQASFTLIDRGGGDLLYMENNEARPMTRVSDTTFIIQQYGIRYTWLLAREMTAQRIDEMRSIIVNDSMNDANENVRHYVLSTTEKRLRATNHTLLYIIVCLALVVLLIARIAMDILRRKRSIERQLRQISEEREQRPQPVRQVLKDQEEEFMRSDYYTQLRRRLSMGDRLHDDEWKEMEQRLNTVYPNFTNHLLNLRHLSELELRTCLLIKLRATPSEMASVLLKEASTISTVRSRLYQKVFGRKGSSRDWDEFVLSL